MNHVKFLIFLFCISPLSGCNSGGKDEYAMRLIVPHGKTTEESYREYLSNELPTDKSRAELKKYLVERQGWNYLATHYSDRVVDKDSGTFVHLSNAGYDYYISFQEKRYFGIVTRTWGVKLHFDSNDELAKVTVNTTNDALF